MCFFIILNTLTFCRFFLSLSYCFTILFYGFYIVNINKTIHIDWLIKQLPLSLPFSKSSSSAKAKISNKLWFYNFWHNNNQINLDSVNMNRSIQCDEWVSTGSNSFANHWTDEQHDHSESGYQWKFWPKIRMREKKVWMSED